MDKYNLIYFHKKSTSLHALFFTKFTEIYEHYIHISHTEFHLNQTSSVKIRAKNSLMPSHKVWPSLHQFSQ
jgi:hypothetical protein